MHAVWDKTIKRLSETRGIEKLAPPVTALMVILLAYSLAKLSWQLIPAPAAGNARPPQAQTALATRGGSASDFARIVEWHLFGHAQAQAPAAPRPVDAPDTNLNLVLRGVAFSEDQSVAHAIIAAGNNETQYTVGAKLQGNVELKEIHPDRVVLLHNGRYETLRLPRDSAVGGAAAAVRPAPPSRPVPATPPSGLREIRDNLLNNPQSFTDIMRINPVNQDGAFIGFRVAPGRKRAMLRQLGLQEGDIITSVNGIQLDDPAKGLEVLNDLRTADEVAVTILRQGVEESLSLQVK